MQRNHAEPPSITRARQFILEHRSEELSLAAVAKAVNMSSYYFCKTFKKVTGLNFTDYLASADREGEGAAADPNARVSEVVFEVGFQSITNFNRIFKRHVGKSPTEYRQSLPKLLSPGLALPRRKVSKSYCLVACRETQRCPELVDDIIAGGESEAPTLANGDFVPKASRLRGIRPVAGVADREHRVITGWNLRMRPRIFRVKRDPAGHDTNRAVLALRRVRRAPGAGLNPRYRSGELSRGNRHWACH